MQCPRESDLPCQLFYPVAIWGIAATPNTYFSPNDHHRKKHLRVCAAVTTLPVNGTIWTEPRKIKLKRPKPLRLQRQSEEPELTSDVTVFCGFPSEETAVFISQSDMWKQFGSPVSKNEKRRKYDGNSPAVSAYCLSNTHLRHFFAHTVAFSAQLLLNKHQLHSFKICKNVLNMTINCIVDLLLSIRRFWYCDILITNYYTKPQFLT